MTQSVIQMTENKPRECFCTTFVAELVFFLYKVAASMLEPTVRLFIYQSVCLNIYPNDTTCFHLDTQPAQEAVVQETSGQYIMYYKILINAPAIFLGLFCGAWSDIVGRKLPVMLPCLGTIFAVLMYMMSLQSEIPSIWMILLGAAINGAFGKSAVITMALHSYASDLSDKDNRTRKLGKLLSMNFFGYFVGSLTVGALLDVFPFDIIFCVVVVVLSFAVITALVFMKETGYNSRATTPSDDGSMKPQKRSLFSLTNVKESLQVICKKRPERQRLHLIMFFMFIILQQICKSGEVDVTLLFVRRSPLSWRNYMYGFLLATDYACLGLSVILLLPFLTHVTHVSDVMLVLVGTTFKVVRLCILTFSTQTWMVYLSVVLGCPSALIISGLKSLISKTVDEDELGKAFSLLASGETISSLIGSVVFLNIYGATAQLFPGFTFGIDTMLHIIILIIMMFVAFSVKIVEYRQFTLSLTSSRGQAGGNYSGTSTEHDNRFVNKFTHIFGDASHLPRSETLTTLAEEIPDDGSTDDMGEVTSSQGEEKPRSSSPVSQADTGIVPDAECSGSDLNSNLSNVGNSNAYVNKCYTETEEDTKTDDVTSSDSTRDDTATESTKKKLS